jgi:hypothetical protein
MRGDGYRNGKLQLVRHVVRERGDNQFFRVVYRTRHDRYGYRDRYICPGYEQARQHHADGDDSGAGVDCRDTGQCFDCCGDYTAVHGHGNLQRREHAEPDEHSNVEFIGLGCGDD